MNDNQPQLECSMCGLRCNGQEPRHPDGYDLCRGCGFDFFSPPTTAATWAWQPQTCSRSLGCAFVPCASAVRPLMTVLQFCVGERRGPAAPR
jgi:hypothetical protein